MRVAQTNLQLYNQLRARGFAPEDLVSVRRAYDLVAELYSGYYQGDGKPFVAHGVGVASILAWLDQPAEIIAVGVLHNIYGNADFGDGLSDCVTPSRRRLVRDAVGPRVDDLLVRFRDLRIYAHTIDGARRALPQRDETERRLILVDLADHLEKYVDLGILYFGESDWIVDNTERIGPELCGLATSLGQPRLAEMLSAAIAEARAQRDAVPAELREQDGRRYLGLVVPRSCKPRVMPAARR